jgi:hypothetical protein
MYDYKNQRPSSPNYIRSKGVESVREYLAKENSESIDGLSGITEPEANSFCAPTGISEDSQ